MKLGIGKFQKHQVREVTEKVLVQGRDSDCSEYIS